MTPGRAESALSTSMAIALLDKLQFKGEHSVLVIPAPDGFEPHLSVSRTVT